MRKSNLQKDKPQFCVLIRHCNIKTFWRMFLFIQYWRKTWMKTSMNNSIWELRCTLRNHLLSLHQGCCCWKLSLGDDVITMSSAHNDITAAFLMDRQLIYTLTCEALESKDDKQGNRVIKCERKIYISGSFSIFRMSHLFLFDIRSVFRCYFFHADEKPVW